MKETYTTPPHSPVPPLSGRSSIFWNILLCLTETCASMRALAGFWNALQHTLPPPRQIDPTLTLMAHSTSRWNQYALGILKYHWAEPNPQEHVCTAFYKPRSKISTDFHMSLAHARDAAAYDNPHAKLSFIKGFLTVSLLCSRICNTGKQHGLEPQHLTVLMQRSFGSNRLCYISKHVTNLWYAGERGRLRLNMYTALDQHKSNLSSTQMYTQRAGVAKQSIIPGTGHRGLS